MKQDLWIIEVARRFCISKVRLVAVNNPSVTTDGLNDVWIDIMRPTQSLLSLSSLVSSALICVFFFLFFLFSAASGNGTRI